MSSSEVTTSDTDGEGNQRIKNIIDPYKEQYTDFLKNVNVWEEANEDTLSAMYVLDLNKRLKGFADAQGT